MFVLQNDGSRACSSWTIPYLVDVDMSISVCVKIRSIQIRLIHLESSHPPVTINTTASDYSSVQFSINLSSSASMTQKVRSAEGLLRSVPEPGQVV